MKYQYEIDSMIAGLEDEFFDNPVEFLIINDDVIYDSEDYIIEAITQLDRSVLLDALDESPILRQAVDEYFRNHAEYFNEKIAEYAFEYYSPENQDYERD